MERGNEEQFCNKSRERPGWYAHLTFNLGADGARDEEASRRAESDGTAWSELAAACHVGWDFQREVECRAEELLAGEPSSRCLRAEPSRDFLFSRFHFLAEVRQRRRG